MKARSSTLLEARYPNPRVFNALRAKWADALARQTTDLLWRAYDTLVKEVLTQVSQSQADEDLERTLTMLLEPRIHRLMTGSEPFYVQHGTYEEETRQPPPAQPPMYDIAFILNANPRFIWPAEAKILPTDKAVGNYVTEIRSNFLTCRYSPFSSQAAMLGYLKSGSSGNALNAISKGLRRPLRNEKGLAQSFSTHLRKIPAGKNYPKRFRCHHLIFSLTETPRTRA